MDNTHAIHQSHEDSLYPIPVDSLLENDSLNSAPRHSNEDFPYPLPIDSYLEDDDPRFPALCSVCRSIFDNWDHWVAELKLSKGFTSPPEVKLAFHHDSLALETAAHAGCPVCSIYRRDIRKLTWDKFNGGFLPSKNDVLTIYLKESESRDAYKFEICFHVPDSDGYRTRYSFSPASQIMARLNTRSTGSRESLFQAKKWLEQCSYSHSCLGKTCDFEPPTRLLELSGETTLRLRQWSEIDVSPVYATLSHCWGNLKILTLKNDNIHLLKRHIPLDELCKTFRDAVTVAKQLEIKYLWIDSLCIIQDDEVDWQIEASRMASVYGNAVVNLAAAHGRNGSFGLFINRDIASTTEHYVRTNTREVFHLPGKAHPFALAFNFTSQMYSKCITTNALSERGWAFQERFLAKRTLHFSAEQIFFECKQGTFCETWPNGHRSLDGHFPHKVGLNDWPEIVQQYSKCKLTYSKDKLIALSGIARLLQSDTQDKYLAGMWRKNLELQLYWWRDYAQAHHQINTQLESHRAPSWSWASVDGSIHWPRLTTLKDPENLIQVLSCNIKPLSPDPFGELESATLKLQCGPIIIPEIFTASPSRLSGQFSDMVNQKKDGSFDYVMSATYDEMKFVVNGAVLPGLFMPCIFDTPGYGIIVEPTNIRGTFSRLGQFMLYDSGSWGASYQAFISRQMEEGNTIHESLYDEILRPNENGIPQYIIKLV